jgi:Nuclease-related domain
MEFLNVSVVRVSGQWVYKATVLGLGMARSGNDRSNADKTTGSQPTEARWEKAEREVCRLLSKLIPEGCLVLNDVAFPYGNLDHLVIRRDGVAFLVETKSHRGRVTWDGRQLLINGRQFSSNPISQLNRSIPWVRKLTAPSCSRKPWIVAILVFPYANVAVRRSVKRVNVVHVSRLLSFIQNYSGSRRKRNAWPPDRSR